MPEIDLDDAVSGADPDAIHDNIANEISAISEKSSLHDDDIVIIEDSEASYVKKRAKKSNFGGGTSLPVDEATAIVKKTGDATALARIGATAHIPSGTTIVVHWPSADLDLQNALTAAAVIAANALVVGSDGARGLTGSQVILIDGSTSSPFTSYYRLGGASGPVILYLYGTTGDECYLLLTSGTSSIEVKAWSVSGGPSNVDMLLRARGSGKIKAEQDGTDRNVAVWKSTLSATQPVLIGTDPALRGSELQVTDGSGFTTTIDLTATTLARVLSVPNSGSSDIFVLAAAAADLTNKHLHDASVKWESATGKLMTLDLSALTGNATLSYPAFSADTVCLLSAIQTLTNKRLASAKFWDTSQDHFYAVAVNELTANRIVTLPLLTGDDEFVFKDHTQTLANKTLTTPTIANLTNMNHDHSATNKGGPLADKYKRRVIPIQVERPVNEQEHLVAAIPYTYTVKEVTYHTSSGTVNINFEHRDKTTMGTASSTKLWSSDQSASTTNVTATTFSGTSEVAADDVLTLTFDSPSSVGTVYIWLEVEIKD